MKFEMQKLCFYLLGQRYCCGFISSSYIVYNVSISFHLLGTWERYLETVEKLGHFDKLWSGKYVDKVSIMREENMISIEVQCIRKSNRLKQSITWVLVLSVYQSLTPEGKPVNGYISTHL